jgi:hypothetical protein
VSRRSCRGFVGEGPADVINIKTEGVGDFVQVLASLLDVFPQHLSADSFDRRVAETDVGSHAHGGEGIVVWAPADWNVLGPFHALYERFDRWRQYELIVRYGNKAELGVKTRLLLYLKQKLATGTYERAVVGKWIGVPYASRNRSMTVRSSDNATPWVRRYSRNNPASTNSAHVTERPLVGSIRITGR